MNRPKLYHKAPESDEDEPPSPPPDEPKPEEPLVPKRPHQLVRRGQPGTSYEAASGVVKNLNTLQQVVYDELERAGVHGLTDLELHVICSAQHGERKESTYRKRRSELAEYGLAVPIGKKLQDGSPRVIWALRRYVSAPK